MPPVKTKKTRKSNTGKTTDRVADMPHSNQITSSMGTPEQNSRKRKVGMITLTQKQALVDNLQLEVTERARKLRAQYALHAQHLRSRLEMRVQRIPLTLRTTNVEQLVDKYGQRQVSAADRPSLQQAHTYTTDKTLIQKLKKVQAEGYDKQAIGGVVYKNDMAMHSDDKENADMDLNLPRKRTKDVKQAAAGTSSTTQATARRLPPSQVLSPKSNNSRNLPKSPLKPVASPAKSFIARITSPLKHAAGSATSERVRSQPTTKAARVKKAPITTQPTRGRGPSSSSNASDSSRGTTIVRKKVAATKKPAAAKAPKASTAAKGRVASKKEAVAPPATGRVLRARR